MSKCVMCPGAAASCLVEFCLVSILSTDETLGSVCTVLQKETQRFVGPLVLAAFSAIVFSELCTQRVVSDRLELIILQFWIISPATYYLPFTLVE